MKRKFVIPFIFIFQSFGKRYRPSSFHFLNYWVRQPAAPEEGSETGRGRRTKREGHKHLAPPSLFVTDVEKMPQNVFGDFKGAPSLCHNCNSCNKCNSCNRRFQRSSKTIARLGLLLALGRMTVHTVHLGFRICASGSTPELLGSTPSWP